MTSFELPLMEIHPKIPDVPREELTITFARSSGPGGQNVNKRRTKAVVKWHVESSPTYSEQEKQRMLTKLANRINNEGFLVVDADAERSQDQNKSNAIAELQRLVRDALKPEIPRIETKPTHASKVRRLDEKSRISRTKELRKPITSDE
jgi:ribosome-associated protein